MNCEQYLEQAFRRSPEKGSGSTADSVSDHLLSCQDCLQASPVLKQFHQFQEVKTPLRFLEGILAKLEHNKTTIKCLDCEHAEEDLSAFLDGELSDEREEEVILHLADCNECTQALSELKGLSGTLLRSYAKPMPIPTDFAAMVTQAAFADEKAPVVAPVLTPSTAPTQPMRIGPRPKFKAWLSAAAALLVTASISIVMLNNNSNPLLQSEMAKADAPRDKAAAKTTASAESVLKFAAEQDKAIKELGLRKLDKEAVAKKPTATPGYKAKNTADAKADSGRGNAFGRGQTFGGGKDAPPKEAEDLAELGAVFTLSAANVDQARVDISLLVSQYSTLWESNGANETWELELSEAEANVLLTKLQRQSNLQLAQVDRQSRFFDFAKSAEDRDGQKGKDTIVNPAQDVENMEKSKKRRNEPKKPAAKVMGAPKIDPALEAKKGVKQEEESLKGVDTVVLRSGWNLSGTILEEGKNSLTMLSAGRKVNVRREDIARLSRASRGRLGNAHNAERQVFRIRLVLSTPREKMRMKRKTEKKK